MLTPPASFRSSRPCCQWEMATKLLETAKPFSICHFPMRPSPLRGGGCWGGGLGLPSFQHQMFFEFCPKMSKGTSQNRKISGTKNAKAQFCKMNHMKLILVDSMYLQPLAQGMARAMCQAVALKDFWTDRIRSCCSGHEDPIEMS